MVAAIVHQQQQRTLKKKYRQCHRHSVFAFNFNKNIAPMHCFTHARTFISFKGRLNTNQTSNKISCSSRRPCDCVWVCVSVCLCVFSKSSAIMCDQQHINYYAWKAALSGFNTFHFHIIDFILPQWQLSEASIQAIIPSENRILHTTS